MNHNVKRERFSEEQRKQKLERDAVKISKYRALTQQVLLLRSENDHSVASLNMNTDILMLNPEFYTMWNYRREIMSKLFDTGDLNAAEVLENDLKLVMALLRRFPKCYWIWTHRRWCLEKLGADANWDFELAVVSKLLAMDQRNFHGWQYRRFVVKNIQQRHSEDKEKLESDIKEFEYTTSKINNNISNFSAWHNRSKLIPKIMELFRKLNNYHEYGETGKLFEDPLTLLKHELQLINTGMYVDVDDTSIWLYLYWLLTDDIFVKGLSQEVYEGILAEQLRLIEELNELERSDDEENLDNCWCLKTIITLKALQMKAKDPQKDLLTDEIKSLLQKLMEIDPLRRGRYVDQVQGKASILY